MLSGKLFLIISLSILAAVQTAGQTTKKDTARLSRNNTIATAKNKTVSPVTLTVYQKTKLHYDTEEKSINERYAKLLGDSQKEKSALEAKVKKIEKEIREAREEREELEMAMNKIEKQKPTAKDREKQERRIAAYKDSMAHMDNELESQFVERGALKAQIYSLEKQIQDLQTAKQKEIDALRKERQKVLAEAAKNKQ